MTVIAHGGAHWAIDIGIYLGPMLVIALALWLSDRRTKRRKDRDTADEGSASA